MAYADSDFDLKLSIPAIHLFRPSMTQIAFKHSIFYMIHV